MRTDAWGLRLGIRSDMEGAPMLYKAPEQCKKHTPSDSIIKIYLSRARRENVFRSIPYHVPHMSMVVTAREEDSGVAYHVGGKMNML